MNLSVAVIASNQDRNLGAIAGYNEAGGAQQLGYRMRDRLQARGVTVRYVVPPLESADDANHTRLKSAFAEAYTWLNGQAAQGQTVCAVHLHTNAAGTPQQGTSHTGYCYTSRVAEGKALGAAICARLAPVLGLPVVAYDYTGKGYLFEVLFGNHASTIVEVTRHDREGDLSVLYEKVELVADALVDGTLAWANAADPAAELRRENEALRAEIAGMRETFQRISALAGSHT